MESLKTLLILSFVALSFAKTITFKDCGSSGSTIHSVDLSPCTTEPCQLHGGTNYTATVNFTASENSPTAKTVVHGIIGGVPVPFPVPSDCCNNHNLKCPVTTGVTDTYVNSIYCSPEYPKIKLLAKWEVQDANGKDIMCFVVPLQIV